jgi:dTDP-4-amino-4,6-dideoxygalactose transaminase
LEVVPFLDLVGINARLRQSFNASWETIMSHGKFIGGPEVDDFERDFAEYCGVGGCVGVGSGTDALELILMALGVAQGDEVIVPANTFVATAEAVCAVGAVPRFVDVMPDTLLIDVNGIEDAINASTAAIIPVHMFGQIADPTRILEIADRHGLAVIEDAAQAHGASFAGRRSGSIGTAAAFSFYPSKNLGALSDAGAVMSSDLDLIAKVRSLGNHGRAATDRNRHDIRGRNSRLDSLQAAILSAKLRLLDRDNAHRVAIMEQYGRELPTVCEPVYVHPQASAVHHLAVIRVPDRDRVIKALSQAGIGCAVHYPIPCHLQSAFREFRRALPVSEHAAQTVLSLPVSPVIDASQISVVCQVLQRILTP